MNSIAQSERRTQVWQFALLYLAALILPLTASYFLFSTGKPVGMPQAEADALKAKLSLTQQRLNRAQAKLDSLKAVTPLKAVTATKLDKINLVVASAAMGEQVQAIQEEIKKSALFDVKEDGYVIDDKPKSAAALARLHAAITIRYFGAEGAPKAEQLKGLLGARAGSPTVNVENYESKIGKKLPNYLEVWLK